MGSQHLSYLQLGKETVKGTPVAATRRLAPSLDSAYQVDFMQNFHENRSTGRRNPINYATSMGTLVTINFQTGPEGIAFNNLQTFWQAPDGGTAVGVGTAVWTHNLGGTAAGTYVTYTAEFGDDVQEYKAEYVFPKSWGISADVGGMTQLTSTLVGRQSTKGTKTAVTPIDNPIRIPSYLWQWKHASTEAGITGASFQTGQLKSFDVQVSSNGLTEAKYLDGTAYFTSGNETLPVAGQVHLQLVHNSDAVTEIYDKAAAGTPTFALIGCTGPVIGASNYAASMEFCWIPEKVQVLSSFIDGQSIIDVTGPLAYDDTWGKTMQTIVTNTVITYI